MSQIPSTTIIENDEPIEETAGETTTVVEVEEQPTQSESDFRTRQELVPVERGVQAANLAGLIDFARTMAKATHSIPQHLRANVGDCLAVIDIATRANLSPYMLAMKTYSQGGKLCFESQAFHAMVQSLGLLKGDFDVEWTGEGDEMRCTVRGTLKSDPDKVKTLTSEPLKIAHPGTTQKDGKTYVKGSPLWARKPKVQLFYDTSRDWIRIFCPVAVLGMYTPEELQEYPQGVNGAIDVERVSPDLHKRLTGGNISRAEGHSTGHAENELAKVAAGDREITAAKTATAKRTAPKGKKPAPKAQKKPARPSPASKPASQPKAAAPKAEKVPEPKAAAIVKTPKEDYPTYARRWIATATSRDDAWGRWDGEREMREDARVPVKVRQELQAEITDKFSDKD